MHRDFCAAQHFQNGKRTAACFGTEMREINRGKSARFAFRIGPAARFAVDCDHGCGRVYVGKSCRKRIVASAECNSDTRSRFLVYGREFIERMCPAIATAEYVRREFVGETVYFAVFQEFPEAAALFFGEVFHRLW